MEQTTMATLVRRRSKDGSISWLATIRVTGYPTTCKTFRTKGEASLWSTRIEAAAKGRTLAVSRGMTVAELIDEGTPKLRNPTTAAFEYWREAIGTLRLIDVTPNVVAVHRDALLGAPCSGHNHRKRKPRSTATVRNYLIELSRLFALAVKEMRVMDSNPVERVSKPAASRWRSRFLTDDEQAALLAACKASDSADLYPFVLFALTTGARKGEISALTWRNVDLRRKWAVFPVTKNGTARGVRLTQHVAALLEQRARDDERVFPVDVTKAWHTAIARAGIVDFKFHDLRHTAGSTLTMNGCNAVEVATVLGHKGLDMVKRYSHLSNQHTSAMIDRVMGEVR
jgi:integrase